MAQDIIIDKVSSIDGGARRVNAIADTPPGEHDDQKFSNILSNPSTQIQSQHVVVSPNEVQKISAPSPMEMAEQVDKDSKRNQTSVKSLEELTQESNKNLQKVIESKRTLEANPNLSFTKEDVRKGTRSLTHVDESLKIALSKVGSDKHVTTAATSQVTDLGKPVNKFLGYLTNTQYEFEHLNDKLDVLSSSGATLSMGNMLALQMKMSIISNQLDFFTGILSKSLEATKTIMNIQV